MTSTQKVRVQVFSRLPIAGKVKTRLLPVISPELAAELQWAWLRHSCSLARTVDSAAQLWLSEPPNQPLDVDCQVCVQEGADLGERMMHATNAALASGNSSLIVGADCPTLDHAYLQAACQALHDYDLVLGPAEDGGYVLIASARQIPEIFENMPWGTDAVLGITRTRLDAMGVSYRLLPVVRDIDTVDDLRHFLGHADAKRIIGLDLYESCAALLGLDKHAERFSK